VSEPGVSDAKRVGPFPGQLDRDLICRYAAATLDPSPAAQAGGAVPVVAIVTQIWAAQESARAALVSPQMQSSASGGVHGEHDIVLHRPIRPGELLQTWVEGFGARPAGRHATVILKYSTFDARDELVAEQWWTTVYLNTTCSPVEGRAPDHSFPETARSRLVGTYTVTADDGMPGRYAEVSGDWAEHHFTAEAAQRSGFERPFLHGLCTLALCAQCVVDTVADGNPDRVRRIAARFAAPVFIGEGVQVSIFEAVPGRYPFEADSSGSPVIRHGLVELRA
jgi:acyl dehydratase